MTSPISMMSFSIGLVLVAATAPSSATEDRFIYVDRMPDIRGEHVRTIEGDDPESGHRIEQALYAEDFEHALIETYVLKVACSGDETTDLMTSIVAVKYPPKKPRTFAVAKLHDIFKEVYALDRNGRIRLYEDVQADTMLELSERFKPACLPI